MNYRQCVLIRKSRIGKDGISEECQTSWIPEPFCVKDKILKLKDENGVWTDGWKVEEVSEPKSEEWVDAHERDYLR
jgi:hypothetical protein